MVKVIIEGTARQVEVANLLDVVEVHRGKRDGKQERLVESKLLTDGAGALGYVHNNNNKCGNSPPFKQTNT